MKTVLILLLYKKLLMSTAMVLPLSVPRHFDSHLAFGVISLKAQPLNLETSFTVFVVGHIFLLRKEIRFLLSVKLNE